ncbi:hypothetical protein ACCW76_04395 [Pantoea sp. C8B4]|uniref:hypothetical protein n=1 Tax=Pantoea sp. C8B4 TaxID=3243083 RepID=UPI003EDB613B
MKKQRIKSKPFINESNVDYVKILNEISSISDVIVKTPFEENKWAEYEFTYNKAKFTFRVVSNKLFKVMTLINFFDFEDARNKLKKDLDTSIKDFNDTSIGFKACRVGSEGFIVSFSSEFVFLNGVINSNNIRINASILSAIPNNLLKSEE